MSDFAERLADQLLEMINSRPRSPTRAEIVTAIQDRLLQAKIKAALKPAKTVNGAIRNWTGTFESAIEACMASKGFERLGGEYALNQDAIVLHFCRDGAQRATVVISGLEQLQNADPACMQALVEARCRGAAGF